MNSLLKSYQEILLDKSDVDKSDAEESLFHLYNSVPGLNASNVEFIWQPNFLDCVEYVRKNKLAKTSAKFIILKELNKYTENRRSYSRWNSLLVDIMDKLLLKSDICCFPQLNREGYDYVHQHHPLIATRRILEPWVAVYNNISFFIPLENQCIVSKSRVQVYGNPPETWTNWNTLEYHRDGGLPAISVKGTNIFDQFWLGGIRIPKKFFKCRVEEINPQEILTLQNVEQRMELIKYVGMELMLKKLPHKVIDSRLPMYELLWIKLDTSRRNSGEKRPHNPPTQWVDEDIRSVFARQEINCFYLKMINPSTGAWHVEAVGPKCRTVQQALNWRAENIKIDEDWIPDQLT